MTGLIDRNFLNSVSNFLVIYYLLSLKICKRGILLLYLTFIALEVKANCCLCLLPPSAVPGEVPISPLVHVPATVVLISKLATPLFERYLGRSHRGTVDWFHWRLHVSQTAWIRRIVGSLAILLAG